MSTTKKVSKIDFLEGFYRHLEEGVWTDGIDLYQSGKVTNVVYYESLVSCRLNLSPKPNVEVRLKLHPSGKVIQWVECTCKRNRTQGQFCEHIAAFLLHIDQEQPGFFKDLDSRMPFNPGTAANKKGKKVATVSVAKGQGQDPAAAQKPRTPLASFLDHLQGSILDTSLNEKSGCIKLKIEIKTGKTNYYELSIDDSAGFLQKIASQDLTLTSPLALPIKQPLRSEIAELGMRISGELDEEKIICEKVVAIKLANRSKILQDQKWVDNIGKLERLTVKKETGNKGQYLTFPLKSHGKFLGNRFFFVPELGYFPLTDAPQHQDWLELPFSRMFRNDEAARIALAGFAGYLGLGPVFLQNLNPNSLIKENIGLRKIKVIREVDGFFYILPLYENANEEISMAELVIAAKKNKRRFFRSGPGWIKIPEFVLHHNWLLSEDETLIKVDRLGLIRLKAAMGDFDQFVGSAKVLGTMRSKTEYYENAEAPDLSASKLKLRAYQRAGYKWFWWLYCNELHGLLADDMGLGKTHQAMALMTAIQGELAKKPSESKNLEKFLVICPTTVLNHWSDKIDEFAPNLRAVIYHGSRRSHSLTQIGNSYETLITSYGVLLRDIKKLEEVKWQAVILDEAHYVKNNNTATYKAACRLNSRIRICLTGTPMENHLGELKNLFDFLAPGFLGSDDYFRRNFVLPIEQDKDSGKEMLLQKLIYPLKLRRKKAEVLDDLPEKSEDIRHCDLKEEQKRFYEQIMEQKVRPAVESLRNEDKPVQYLHIFAILQLLKQVCDHPALLHKGKSYKDFKSGKFDLLMELIDEAIDSGNKIVIFSQYVGMLELIKEYCDDKGIGAVVLSGQTRNRGKVIESFQNDPNIKIFIGSLLAGGLGIDLTAASVVIHYDRWWNPTKENQATDRVHRIGQKKFVQVFKLVTRASLEEKIDLLIRKKQESFDKFLEKDVEIFSKFSRHELIELLQ